MKQTFTVVVERDPESGWLVGEVVELSGCSTQAPDLPTLETNIREAIRVALPEPSAEKPPLLVADLRWTPQQAADTRARLASFAEDWDAPGMEGYDDL